VADINTAVFAKNRIDVEWTVRHRRRQVHHRACDFMLLEHDRDCLSRVDARVAFATALGVYGECVFQLICQTKIIDD